MNKIKRFVLFSALLGLSLTGCGKTPATEGSDSNELPQSESEVISEEPSEEKLSFPRVIFKATSPIDVPNNAVIKVAGNFNDWNPYHSEVSLEQEEGRVYTATLDFTEDDIGEVLEYKYILLFDDQSEDNMWSNVEGSETGGEVGNRTVTLQAGIQTANDTIRSFKNTMDENSVTRGTLEKVTLKMTQYEDNRKRTIRIWLPDGYDKNDTTKKYPVFYMHDGQNLFDKYTAFVGVEWQVDEAIGAMMDEGYEGTIVVGIDNGPDRLNEYSPEAFPVKERNKGTVDNPSGEKYAAFIVETVKPYIDANYNVLTDREHTGVGGSSMGGIINFYMALTYPEIFGYAMPFSSSHWLYEEDHIQNFINEVVPSGAPKFPRLYFWVGGEETSITGYPAIIKNALMSRGYNYSNIKTTSTPGGIHSEQSWADAFPAAYRWLVKF